MISLGQWPARQIAETDRLLLVVPNGSYAKRMAEYAEKNREFHRHAMPTPPEEWGRRSFWHKWLVRRLSEYRLARIYGFLLLDKSQSKGPILGDCTFSQVVRGPLDAAVLGYKMDEEHAGKGYMREALEAALEFMFSGVGLHRVEANVKPDNERSYHLLRRLGFVVEGYSKSYLKLDGRWEDHLRLAMMNPSFDGPAAKHLDLSKLGVELPDSRTGKRSKGT